MATKTAKKTKAPAKSATPGGKDAVDAALDDGCNHSFPRRATGEADVMPVARRSAKLLAGALRAVFQPLAEERLTVTAQDACIVAHDEWLAEQGSSMGLAFYQLPPMKGRMAIRLSHDLIAALVDAFFGGSIQRNKGKKADFSQTDTRLMNRIAQSCTTQIGAAWCELGPFRCLAAGLTDDPEEAKLATGDAPLLIQSFTLAYPGNVNFTVDCVYPVEMIQSAREIWAMANPEQTLASDPAWRQNLGTAVTEVFLPVRSVLARPTMTLPELADLKPGDIIPIPPARNLQLLIGDRPFARGSMGEQNGMAAFRIDYLEKG